MKTKLHTLLLYPLVLLFSAFLKGKKIEYKKFFLNSQNMIKNKNILNIFSHDNEFYEHIKLFFDKSSPLYDKVSINFTLNLQQSPEDKKYLAFDFLRVIKIYYTLSMLSARVPNNNIVIGLECTEKIMNDTQINKLLRYFLLSFASKRVDNVSFNEIVLSGNSKLAYEVMKNYMNNTTIINFTNSKDLYVITCKNNKKKFDIIWSSGEDIELTEFNFVYDKYGKQLSGDIKITHSPIYAFHE